MLKSLKSGFAQLPRHLCEEDVEESLMRKYNASGTTRLKLRIPREAWSNFRVRRRGFPRDCCKIREFNWRVLLDPAEIDSLRRSIFTNSPRSHRCIVPLEQGSKSSRLRGARPHGRIEIHFIPPIRAKAKVLSPRHST